MDSNHGAVLSYYERNKAVDAGVLARLSKRGEGLAAAYHRLVASTHDRVIRLRDALVPFDASELRRLARYCAKASELRESQFLAEPQTIEASFGSPGPLTYEITNASRAVVNAVVPPLRVLYTPREPASFAGIRSLLAQHITRLSSSAAGFSEVLQA